MGTVHLWVSEDNHEAEKPNKTATPAKKYVEAKVGLF